jgi:hypothetical protein
LAAEELAGALLAAELAELPLLDLIGADVRAAVENPDSNAWAELNVLLRSK